MPSARAGGEMGDAKHQDEGTRFFGFVRDANGKPVVEAKVSADIKNGIKYVTHTAKNGMYSFGGFNKSVKPDDVTISCGKEKFRQTRVIRKTQPSGKAVKSVETECRMQPE
jgi:O-glycosyl hydrolase